MIVKCPVCKDRHILPNHDSKDYICENSNNRVSPKTWNNMTPTDLMTRNRASWNVNSTKIDEVRPATVQVVGPSFRSDGSKIGSLKKNY